MLCMSIMYEQVHTECFLFSSYAYSYFAKIFGQKPIFRKFSFCTWVCKNLISKYLKQSVYILSSGDKGLHFYENQDKNIFSTFTVNVVCVCGGGAVCVFVFWSFSILFALSDTTFFPTTIFSEHYFLLFFPFALIVWLGQSIKIYLTSYATREVSSLSPPECTQVSLHNPME